MTTEILQVADVSNGNVRFTDYSGVPVEYAPDAEPGDWYMVVIDDETGSILDVEKR